MLGALSDSVVAMYAMLAAMSVLRYVCLAGVAWLLMYVFARDFFAARRIGKARVSRRQIIRELRGSVSTLLIFPLGGSAIFLLDGFGVTRIYYSVSEFGWIWFLVSIPAIILLHDMIGYWSHRLLHTRLFYSRFHAAHHESVDLNPWSSFCLHPGEAIMHVLSIVLIAMILPLHPVALFIFMFILTLYSVLSHGGFEFFPESVRRHSLGRLINTPTAHSWHHRNSRVCLGLYFNIWDRLAGTFADVQIRESDAGEVEYQP